MSEKLSPIPQNMSESYSLLSPLPSSKDKRSGREEEDAAEEIFSTPGIIPLSLLNQSCQRQNWEEEEIIDKQQYPVRNIGSLIAEMTLEKDSNSIEKEGSESSRSKTSTSGTIEGEGGGGGGGVLGIIRKSANVSFRRKSKNNKKSSNFSASSSKEKMDPATSPSPVASPTNPKENVNTANRRVVKATPPPPVRSDIVETRDRSVSLSRNNEDDFDKGESHGKEARYFVLPGKAPSVEEEQRRELTEKWRKERLDATAAVRKEHREKDVEQRRKLIVLSSDDEKEIEKQESSNISPTKSSKENGNLQKQPLPAILSVEPKFPEHKRSVEKASLPESRREEEPSEKRCKVDQQEAEVTSITARGTLPTPDLEENEKEAGGWSNLAGWVKSAVPAVAVLAVVSVIAINILRKK